MVVPAGQPVIKLGGGIASTITVGACPGSHIMGFDFVGTTCDQIVFVALATSGLPLCDTEAAKMWNDFAIRADDPTTLTMADVDNYWAECGGTDISGMHIT